MNDKYEMVLNRKINDFLEEIEYSCSKDCKKLKTDKPDFQIFEPEDNLFYLQKHYINTLEWYIRDYLVTGIITQWIVISGLRCCIQKNEHAERVFRNEYSNQEYGEDYLYAFLIEKDGRKIAYRYSILPDEILFNKMSKSKIDYFVIIDFNAEQNRKRRNLSDKEKYILFKDFLLEYFSEELTFLYLDKVKEAVSKARDIIGLRTVSYLSSDYLSDYKSRILSDIVEFNYSTTKYIYFNEDGVASDRESQLLSTADYEIIKNRVYTSFLYQTLVGDEKFAKCFVTSEYLYSIFKAQKNENFDYSSVVSGYFKSVELMLERIMLSVLENNDNTDLWIKSNNNRKVHIDDVTYRKHPKTKQLQVRFSKINQSNFSTEMGPLIWFLYDNINGWYISENGRNIVHSCLYNYNKACRNEHLHKDLINSLEEVEHVRTNTLLCLLYLLGGCKMYASSEEDYCRLYAFNDSFEKLYNKLLSIPRSIKAFSIQFQGKEEIKAIRLLEQDRTQHDTTGKVITSLKFVKVNDFFINDYGEFIEHINPENIIIISKDNVPDKMWWYSFNKRKVEIIWKE